jgi:hypothetical protein
MRLESKEGGGSALHVPRGTRYSGYRLYAGALLRLYSGSIQAVGSIKALLKLYIKHLRFLAELLRLYSGSIQAVFRL